MTLYVPERKVLKQQPQQLTSVNATLPAPTYAINFAVPGNPEVINNKLPITLSKNYAGNDNTYGLKGTGSAGYCRHDFSLSGTHLLMVLNVVIPAYDGSLQFVCERSSNANSVTGSPSPFWLIAYVSEMGNGSSTKLTFAQYGSSGTYGAVSIPVPSANTLHTLAICVDLDLTGYSCVKWIYMDGVKQTLTGGLNSKQAGTYNTITDHYFNCRAASSEFSKVQNNLTAFYNYKTDEALAQKLSENPWQIFAPRRQWFAIGSTGNGVVLAGDAAAVATATGAIASTIAIDGAAVSLATATGAVYQTIDIVGSAASVSVAEGVVTITTTLAGDAFNEAFATGLINQALDLESAASATATATGAMGMTLTLAGDAIAQALASASFDANAVVLAGDAQSDAVATGALLADVALLGAAQVTVTGSGGMTHTHALDSAAAVVASGSGNLILNVSELSGNAVAQVLAGGSIQFVTQIEAHALAQVTAQMINTGIFASDRKIEKWTMRPARNYALIAPTRNYTLAAVA